MGAVWGVLGASGLLNHDVDLVAVVHFQGLWGVVILDALTVENESALVVGEALSLAVSFHELLELRGPFDLEKDFGTVLSLHLYVELLGAGGLSVVVSCGCC